MKKTARNILFMLGFAWKHGKAWVILSILKNVSLVVVSLVMVVAPKFIIDELLNQKRLDALILIVAVVAITVFVFTQLGNFLMFRLNVYNDELSVKFNVIICELAAKIDYKYLESPEYLDLRGRVSQNDFTSYCGVLDSFFSAFRYLCLIAGVSSIIITLNPFVVVLIVVIICLNGIANSRNNKNAYKFQTLLMPIDRKIFHLTGFLSDFSYGKEIRINDMNPFMMKKYYETAVEATSVLGKWLAFSNKTSYLRYFMAFVQLIAVYGYLAVEVVKNGLSIGNFAMCFSAINELSISLDGVVTEIQNITKMCPYIDDLKKAVFSFGGRKR